MAGRKSRDGKQRSFIMYDSYGELVDGMTDPQLATYTRAIFAYRRGLPLPEMDQATNFAFVVARQWLDINSEEYELECERRREAGSKGGITKRENAKRSSATNGVAKGSSATNATHNGSSATNEGNAVADNDNDNENDTENENDNDNDLKKKRVSGDKKQAKRKSNFLTVEEEKQMITDSGIPTVVAVVFDEWCDFRQEMGKPLTPTGFKQTITKVQNAIAEHGEEFVRDCIRDCMSSGYQGLFFDRQKASQRASDGYSAIAAFVAEDSGDLPFV